MEGGRDDGIFEAAESDYFISEQQAKIVCGGDAGKTVADHLQISLRTLQNEIAAINRGPKGPIISSSNRGYSLNKEAINSLHLSPQLQDDDEMQILKCLLLERGPFCLEDMEDRFFLSTSAFLNKVKKLNGVLAEYRLEIRREKNQVGIEGTEYQMQPPDSRFDYAGNRLTYDSLEIASNYFKNINTVEVPGVDFVCHSQAQLFYRELLYNESGHQYPDGIFTD